MTKHSNPGYVLVTLLHDFFGNDRLIPVRDADGRLMGHINGSPGFFPAHFRPTWDVQSGGATLLSVSIRTQDLIDHPFPIEYRDGRPFIPATTEVIGARLFRPIDKGSPA